MPRVTVHSVHSPEEKFLINERKWADHFGAIRVLLEEYPRGGDFPLDLERGQVGEIQNFIYAYYGPHEDALEREVVTKNFILQLPSVEEFLRACYRLKGWMGPFYSDLFSLLDEGFLRVNLHTLPPEAQADFFESVELLSNCRVSEGVLKVMDSRYQHQYREMVRVNQETEEEWDREE